MTRIVLTTLADASNAFQFLNPIDDIHAWIKDINGKFVLTNERFIERFGFSTTNEMIGLTDFDLAPHHMAARYIEDDTTVLNGKVITDRLELIIRKNKAASWFSTSKWPIYDTQENIIGTFGFSIHLNQSHTNTTPFRELDVPIEYIHQNFDDNISVVRLAEACHVSVSTLGRRFKKHLSKTPQQYITEVRLDKARVLVFDTENNLSNIAQEIGFVDNSHFTRAYKKRFKASPSEDRKKYKSNQDSR